MSHEAAHQELTLNTKHYPLLYQFHFKLQLLALCCECVGKHARTSTQASVFKLTPGNLKHHTPTLICRA